MKKGFKALAVLSLFGLGLGSVSACGGPSKSITISVNGTAVPNGGNVTVDKYSTINFSAMIDGGSETDSIVWATSSPKALTFDSNKGLEVSAKANLETTTGWTVSATLEGDTSVTTSILVYVNDVEETYGLTVDVSEMKTTYLRGETFSSDGLSVLYTTFANGEPIDSYEIGSDEYTLSLQNGEKLDEEGEIEVTVTAKDTSLGSTTFTINVGKNDNYAINTNLDYYEENTDLELIALETYVDEQGKTQVMSSQITSTWDDYVLDSTNQAVYHAEDGFIRKYEFGYDENNNIALKDAGYIYDSYYELEGDPSLMLDINMSLKAQDFSRNLFTDLVLLDEGMDEESGVNLALYQAQASSNSTNIYSFAAGMSTFGQVASVINQIMPGYATLDVLVLASGDYATQIMVNFKTNEVIASELGIPASGTSMFVISPVSLVETETLVSPEKEVQDIIENKEFTTADNITPTFEKVVDAVAAGNFDATFGDAFFSDLNCEYHGTDDYMVIAQNIVNYASYDSQGYPIGNPVSIDTSANMFFNVNGETFNGHTFAADSTVGQVIYESTQSEIEQDESGEFILTPSKFKSVSDLALTSENMREYNATNYISSIKDLSMYHPSSWNGFIKEIGGLEKPAIEYWDKQYEQAGHDEKLNVDFVTGSYNLYGTLALKGSSGVILNDMWEIIQTLCPIIGTVNEQQLGFSNCKINVQYQLVDDDWSNENSFIRIYTYIADHSSEETWYQNLGYADIMTITNIGSGSYKPADEFVSLLQPANA